MTKIERIRFLVSELNRHNFLYYEKDAPIISDVQYDTLYDELVTLEKETEFILGGSPTQKVQGQCIDAFVKTPHSVPVLSAQKTKNKEEINTFLGDKDYAASYKLDGLTCVVRYKNGHLFQAITRGNGEIGEDVTHNMKLCQNLPQTISYLGDLEVRGECVISKENFEFLNEGLEEKFSNPRNTASGALRQLDSNVFKNRYVDFIAFKINTKIEGMNTKEDMINKLFSLGFEAVPTLVTHNTPIYEVNIKGVERTIKVLDIPSYKYPCDGLIFEFNDLAYGESLGRTSHHFNDMIAFKQEDELFETVLRDIEWNTSKDGRLFPTAVFDVVEMDGSNVERATLHNIAYIRELELGIGDSIQVSKRGMIIPCVEFNTTKSNTYELPKVCPSCGSILKIKKIDTTEYLYCDNENCFAQKLALFSHFVSKKAVNIIGLSEAILERFLQEGFIKQYKDLFNLTNCRDRIVAMDGFGEKSYNKIVDSIDSSKNTTLDRFIYSLSIPNIGSTTAKTISNAFGGDFNKFYKNVIGGFDFTKLEDCGETVHNSIISFFKTEKQNPWIEELSKCFIFEKKERISTENSPLQNKTVVVTGTLVNFNRDSIKEKLESLGAKVTDSVSKNTNFLICGEKAGSKLDKAYKLGVRVLTESEFLGML